MGAVGAGRIQRQRDRQEQSLQAQSDSKTAR